MSKIYAKDRFESILEMLFEFLNKNKKIYHISLGYLSAVGIDAINGLNKTGLIETFKNVFFMSKKMSNIMTYISITIIFLYFILLFLLKQYFKNKTVDNRLRLLYEKYTDPIFQGHETEGISWGLGQTVMSSPNLRDGIQIKLVLKLITTYTVSKI